MVYIGKPECNHAKQPIITFRMIQGGSRKCLEARRLPYEPLLRVGEILQILYLFNFFCLSSTQGKLLRDSIISTAQLGLTKVDRLGSWQGQAIPRPRGIVGQQKCDVN